MALSVLNGVFDDALRHRLREELGLTYGPEVGVTTADLGDQGDLETYVQTSPADADRVADEIQSTARRLAQGGVTDAEIEAARKPLVAALSKKMATNQYWLDELSGADHPQDAIDDIRQRPQLLSAVTPDEVRRAAATWLMRKPIIVVITPAVAKTATGSTPATPR